MKKPVGKNFSISQNYSIVNKVRENMGKSGCTAMFGVSVVKKELTNFFRRDSKVLCQSRSGALFFMSGFCKSSGDKVAIMRTGFCSSNLDS